MQTLEEWKPWYHAVSIPEPRAKPVHRRLEEPLLEAWDNRLAAQKVYFDICIAKQIGQVRVVDEKSVASLRIDQGLLKPAIEKAVDVFIRDSSWPALTHREYLHLIVRIELARKVVDAIRQGTPQGMVVKSQMPDLANREYAIRWFLIDLWNLAGKAFLAAMARDFSEKRTESVSDRNQVEQLTGEQTN